MAPTSRQDDLYSYAADRELHFSLWRSLAAFDNRCSLRTWTYRVAHNTATTCLVRQRRAYTTLVSLEELDDLPGPDRSDSALDQRNAPDRLFRLIQSLKPLDLQVIISWLEGMDAVSIGEITGISPPNVAMKVYRIKAVLTRRFHSGVRHAECPPSAMHRPFGRTTVHRKSRCRSNNSDTKRSISK